MNVQTNPAPIPRGEPQSEPMVSQPQKKESFSEATLAKVKELQEELDSIWAEINPALAATKDLRARKRKLSEQVSCLRDPRVPMDAQLKTLGLTSEDRAVKELAELEAAHSDVWAKINPRLAATKPKRLERDRLRRTIEDLAKRIPSVQDRERKLELMARKGECESKLKPIADELRDAQRQLDPLFLRQQELQEKLKAATKALFDLDAKETELNKIVAEYAPVQKELGPLFERQKAIQAQLDLLDPTRVYRRWSQRPAKREDKADDERRNAQLIRLYSQPKNGGSHRKRNLDLKAREEERAIRQSSATPAEARERIRELRRSRRTSRPKKDNNGGKKKGGKGK